MAHLRARTCHLLLASAVVLLASLKPAPSLSQPIGGITATLHFEGVGAPADLQQVASGDVLFAASGSDSLYLHRMDAQDSLLFRDGLIWSATSPVVGATGLALFSGDGYAFVVGHQQWQNFFFADYTPYAASSFTRGRGQGTGPTWFSDVVATNDSTVFYCGTHASTRLEPIVGHKAYARMGEGLPIAYDEKHIYEFEKYGMDARAITTRNSAPGAALAGNAHSDSVDVQGFISITEGPGHVLQTWIFGGPEDDSLEDIVVTDAGYAACGRYGSGGQTLGWIMMVDTTGQVLWEKQLARGSGAGFQRVVMRPNGALAASGFVEDGGEKEIWLALFSERGQLQQEWIYQRGGELNSGDALDLDTLTGGYYLASPSGDGTLLLRIHDSYQRDGIALLDPNGGEMWTVGEQIKIRWQSWLDPPPSQFHLAFSPDDGETWRSLGEASGDSNTWSYVPQAEDLSDGAARVALSCMVGARTWEDTSAMGFHVLDGMDGGTLAAGWNLASIPVEPTIPLIDSLYGGEARIDTILGWDPAAGFVALEELHAGTPFWVKLHDFANLSVPGDSSIAAWEAELSPGWNLLGLAGVEPIPLEGLSFEAYGTQLGMDSAMAMNWLLDKPLGWLATEHGYAQRTDSLRPWRGYWIACTTPVTVRQATAGRMPSHRPQLRGSDSRSSQDINDWSLPLHAHSALAFDSLARIGCHSEATNLVDLAHDMPSPPWPDTSSVRVRLSLFIEEGHPLFGASYDTDLRDPLSPGETEIWFVNLEAFPAQDVLLSWPDPAEHLPEGYQARIAGLPGAAIPLDGAGSVIVEDVENRDLYLIVVAASSAGPEGDAPAREFRLEPLYPNPFNSTSRVRIQMPRRGELVLDLWNVLGQKVATLHRGELTAGSHRFLLDGTGWGSGIYVLRARHGAQQQVRKVLLLR